jgi:hypothetical protein
MCIHTFNNTYIHTYAVHICKYAEEKDVRTVPDMQTAEISSCTCVVFVCVCGRYVQQAPSYPVANGHYAGNYKGW